YIEQNRRRTRILPHVVLNARRPRGSCPRVRPLGLRRACRSLKPPPTQRLTCPRLALRGSPARGHPRVDCGTLRLAHASARGGGPRRNPQAATVVHSPAEDLTERTSPEQRACARPGPARALCSSIACSPFARSGRERGGGWELDARGGPVWRAEA